MLGRTLNIILKEEHAWLLLPSVHNVGTMPLVCIHSLAQEQEVTLLVSFVLELFSLSRGEEGYIHGILAVEYIMA